MIFQGLTEYAYYREAGLMEPLYGLERANYSVTLAGDVVQEMAVASLAQRPSCPVRQACHADLARELAPKVEFVFNGNRVRVRSSTLNLSTQNR